MDARALCFQRCKTFFRTGSRPRNALGWWQRRSREIPSERSPPCSPAAYWLSTGAGDPFSTFMVMHILRIHIRTSCWTNWLWFRLLFLGLDRHLVRCVQQLTQWSPVLFLVFRLHRRSFRGPTNFKRGSRVPRYEHRAHEARQGIQLFFRFKWCTNANYLRRFLGWQFFEAPWRRILASKPFWALLVEHFAFATGLFTFITQIPTFVNGTSTSFFTNWVLAHSWDLGFFFLKKM